jgi:predicted metal-binding membrane protein
LGQATELRLTAALLVGLAALAWVVTANRMAGMDMGPGTDLGGLGWFAGVWAVMMAAMMLPSLVPMAAAAGRGAGAEPLSRTVLFAAGYLGVWAIAGVVAWALVKGVRSLDPAFLAWSQAGRYVAGAAIAAAARYELTPMKASCLRHCRDRRLLVAGWRPGPLGALRLGVGQGAYCLGSSGALMVALFALGVMSITWMVVIAALVAIEKLLPRASLATGAVAAVLLVLAFCVAFVPEQLPGLTIPGTSP